VIRTRRASPADAPAVGALVERAYATYAERMGFRPAPMDVDYETELRGREGWLALADGDVVGVLVVHADPDHLFVHNVAVDADFQGSRGLGKALLELAERRAAELGLSEIRLVTNELMTENRAIYAHLGWEETEVRSEHGYRRVYFRKRLADRAATPAACHAE
jgi:ribosomal protein S18 acetylase RimI-like enzyme